MLADVIRIDRRQLRPLELDTPATTTQRASCHARHDLVEHRVRLPNQLRAHLKVRFPAAAGLMAAPDRP